METECHFRDGADGIPEKTSNADLRVDNELTIFTPKNVPLASAYLVEVLGQSTLFKNQS